MWYEARGDDENALYVAILKVLDSEHIRLNVVEHSTVAAIERVTFEVMASTTTHKRLLSELRANLAADRVTVFRDPEEE